MLQTMFLHHMHRRIRFMVASTITTVSLFVQICRGWITMCILGIHLRMGYSSRLSQHQPNRRYYKVSIATNTHECYLINFTSWPMVSGTGVLRNTHTLLATMPCKQREGISHSLLREGGLWLLHLLTPAGQRVASVSSGVVYSYHSAACYIWGCPHPIH